MTSTATAYDEHGRYMPAPGTEYPFSISDIARATARILGPDWMAESGYWGVSGTLSGPRSAQFEFFIDEWGDLCIGFRRSTDDNWPEEPELPDGILRGDFGVYLELASAADGLDSLAERSAAAVRAVTGAQ
ncbi:hypothetical protein [Streptomyces sp. NPDC085937]|uniref:hypothetical protein n=1 Tax=Streptomyces sp. NPDC085937 TaxID=3365742 RepID=UPI0037D2F74B